jgi:MerR family redox-sensitive transcriptional activator SoxR
MPATATDSERMTIGQVAAHAGVRASTIRYYESIGVLPEPERQAGQRRYTIDVLRRLAIIDIAQRAGFSLDEIRQLLDGSSPGKAHESVRALAEGKLPSIEALIQRAEAVRRWLEVASSCECSTLDVCALFDDRALGLPSRRTGDSIPIVSVIAVAAAAGSRA